MCLASTSPAASAPPAPGTPLPGWNPNGMLKAPGPPAPPPPSATEVLGIQRPQGPSELEKQQRPLSQPRLGL